MLPVLSKDRLFKNAPSIFTNGKSHKTSEKYQPISTEILIDKLMNEGFFPTWATQSASRGSLQEGTKFPSTLLQAFASLGCSQ